jgi:CRISPR-associated endoribonuclease Cas6
MTPFEIKFKIFEFKISALNSLLLPAYKGSTLRGGFGHAFKKAVCAIKTKECAVCILKEKCIYSYIFETPPPSATEKMRKYKAAPHPFIIEPSLEEKTLYKPGEELSFRLILIGKAAEYLPYFIYAFDELGKQGIGKGRGKYSLKEVSRIIPGTAACVIYQGAQNVLRDDSRESALAAEAETEPLDRSSLTIKFITPTRIVKNEKLVSDLEFHILLGTLLRRLSMLSYFHCGIKDNDFDFRGFIEKAEKVKIKEQILKWRDWERYSARQDTTMKMGGFTGKAVFEGELYEFMPYIRLGEILHVGKGTGFGLGKYEILDDGEKKNCRARSLNRFRRYEDARRRN